MSTDAAELPEGWRVVTLSDVATTSAGGTPKAKTLAYYDNGDIPWLKIGDLNDGEVVAAEQTITQAGFDSSAAKWVESGAVLVAMYGSIGKLGILRMRATTNQAICAVTPDSEQVTTEWLYWVLRSQRAALDRIGRGGTQRNISQGDLKKWPIPVPPIDEQRAIVAAIENAFAAIEAVENDLVAAERLLITLQLAGLRDAASGALLALSTDDESGLPAGWEWREVGDIAAVSLGRQKSPEHASGPNMLPYIRAANLTWAGFDLGDVKTMNFSADEQAKFSLRDGDVLVCEASGSATEVGKAAIWRGEIATACFQNHVLRLRPEDVSPEYLHLVITEAARLGRFAGAVSGIGITNLGLKRMRTWRIPVPPRNVQDAVVAAHDGLVERQVNLQRLIDDTAGQLSAMRASVLHAAMSGQLVQVSGSRIATAA